MMFLLGRSYKLKSFFLKNKIAREKFLKYCVTKKCYTILPDYDLEEKLLLSDENRRKCMERICRSPPVRIQLRGTTNETKFAAVLIALCTNEKMKSVSLLYTRRSHLLSRHKRQISFPGGIKESNEDFVECALREAQEEIGLSPSRVEIWGTGSLISPPHTAAIMPVIGVVKHFKESELKLNTAEVEEAFTIPITKLASPQNLYYTQFKNGYSSPVFLVDNKRIWGVTGFITNIFLNSFLPLESNNIQNRVKFIKSYKSNPS